MYLRISFVFISFNAFMKNTYYWKYLLDVLIIHGVRMPQANSESDIFFIILT